MHVPSRHPKSNVLQKQGKKENITHPPRTSSLLERRTCILFVLSCLFAFSYLVANENSASNLILTGELLSRTHILSTATRMLGCRLSCLFVPCCLHWDLFKGCSHVSFCLVPSEPGTEYGAVGAEHERPHWVTWQTAPFSLQFRSLMFAHVITAEAPLFTAFSERMVTGRCQDSSSRLAVWKWPWDSLRPSSLTWPREGSREHGDGQGHFVQPLSSAFRFPQFSQLSSFC